MRARAPAPRGRGARSDRALQRCGGRSVDLPEPLTPVTTVSVPSGKRDVDVLQVEARARRARRARVPLPARRSAGAGMRELAAQEARRSASRRARPRPACPRATMRPPWRPGAGADVDQPVGGAQRGLVVLDDDDGVAARRAARSSAPSRRAVVARVQADRRLVEHVEHALQAARRAAPRAGCAAPRRPRACPRARSSVR